MRAEHNCRLCRNEWLGRCFSDKLHGKDVSMNGDRYKNEYGSGDLPICDDYIYGGSEEHLKRIQYAQSIGVTELTDEQVKNIQ